MSALKITQKDIIAAIAFFLLFAGIGRMFSLVTHDPVLGYANSYDMIRLQACHQIWPEDSNIDIREGTPNAPLRRYTLNKHVETSCFPSSELIFTGTGIQAAKLKNYFTGEKLVSIKTIGFTKAIFLAITALLFAVYCYRKQQLAWLATNAGMTLLVLSDPAVTLYLNTFYTEFSALYFLYIALTGLVVLYLCRWQCSGAWCLAAGLIGLGFAKPQHVPLALILGGLVVAYLLIIRQRFAAVVIATSCLLPAWLQSTDLWNPRNENMALANKVNTLGSLLGVTTDGQAMLDSLELPDDCLLLAGKNWYGIDVVGRGICKDLTTVSHSELALASLSHPGALGSFIWAGLRDLRKWHYGLYGQVEGSKHVSATTYHGSLGSPLRKMPRALLLALLALPVLLLPAIANTSAARNGGIFLMFLLAVTPWIIYGIALIGDGFVDLGKHAHLVVPALFFYYLAFLSMFFNKEDQ